MRREKYYGRRPLPGGGANFGGLDQFGRPIPIGARRGGNLGGAVATPQGKIGGTNDPGRGAGPTRGAAPEGFVRGPNDALIPVESTSTRPILDVSDSITGPRPGPPAGPSGPKPFFVPNGSQNASTELSAAETPTPTSAAAPTATTATTATTTTAETEAPSTESTLPMKTGLAGANFGLAPTQVKEMTRGRGYGMTYMPQQRDPKEITYGGGGTGGDVINFAPIMTQQANPIMAVGGFGGRMAGGLPDLPIDTGTIFDPGTIGGGAVAGGGATAGAQKLPGLSGAGHHCH